MLAKVDRPCSTAATIVREVVVEEDQVGGLARDVGAGAAHRHPDRGFAQRGRVVDPVAGHGHDMTALLQRLGDAQLVLGGDPGDDHAVTVEQLAELVVVRPAGRDRRRRARSAPSRPTSSAMARAVSG